MDPGVSTYWTDSLVDPRGGSPWWMLVYPLGGCWCIHLVLVDPDGSGLIHVVALDGITCWVLLDPSCEF